MPEKNPFEHILGQIADMVAFVQKNKDKAMKGDLPEDFDLQLNILEQAIQIYRSTLDETLKEAGGKPDPDALPTKDKRFLRRAQKLKEEALALKNELVPKKHVQKLKKKMYGKKGDKKSAGRARKKKFKRLGGDKDWLPL